MNVFFLCYKIYFFFYKSKIAFVCFVYVVFKKNPFISKKIATIIPPPMKRVRVDDSDENPQQKLAKADKEENENQVLSHLHLIENHLVVYFPKPSSDKINAMVQGTQYIPHSLQSQKNVLTPEFWRHVHVVHVVWESPTQRILSALRSADDNEQHIMLDVVVPELAERSGAIFQRLQRLLSTIPGDWHPSVEIHTNSLEGSSSSSSCSELIQTLLPEDVWLDSVFFNNKTFQSSHQLLLHMMSNTQQQKKK